MQMIERPWGIAVYSTASVKAAPDLVRLRFRVARLEQTPAEAFAAAAEAVGAVRQAIRARDVPDAAVQRSRLSLKSQWSREGTSGGSSATSARHRSLSSPVTWMTSSSCWRASVVHIEDEDPEQVRGPYRSHSSARMEASEEDLAPGHACHPLRNSVKDWQSLNRQGTQNGHLWPTRPAR